MRHFPSFLPNFCPKIFSQNIIHIFCRNVIKRISLAAISQVIKNIILHYCLPSILCTITFVIGLVTTLKFSEKRDKFALYQGIILFWRIKIIKKIGKIWKPTLCTCKNQNFEQKMERIILEILGKHVKFGENLNDEKNI